MRRADSDARGDAPSGPSSLGIHFSLAGDQRTLPLRFARLGAAASVSFVVFVATPSAVGPFVVVSRLIPYKRVDLAVQACTELNLPLNVIGDGSELARLQAMAGPSVRFSGRLDDAQIAEELGQAKAFIFTGEEDFGLTPLEAMACGTPVIAFAKGGALETVVNGTTGSFFAEQTVESLKVALQAFKPESYEAAKIRTHAEGYDQAIFIKKIQQFVDKKLEEGVNK